MPYSHTHAHSPYLVWVKIQPHAKYNLATSGVVNFPLAQLPVRLEDLEISGQTPGYGWAPLQESLSRHTKVPKECIVAAIGTSMAIYLAYAGTLEPGDDVLVEHPAYEPMFLAAQLAGGLGLAPSANIHPGRTSLFEPVHGSAPNIAGKGIANPFGSILTAGLLMEFLGWNDEAHQLKQSVKSALNDNITTPDLGGSKTTAEVSDFLLNQIAKHSSNT